MTISNDQYTQAMQVIAEREAEAASDSLDVVNHIQDAFKPCLDEITKLHSDLPATNYAIQSSTRGLIENLYNQMTSFVTQLGYTKTGLQNAKAQYEQSTATQ